MFKILKSYIILIAIILNSSIFAGNVNFSNPTSTPVGTTPPNLSDPGDNALEPEIGVDSSGRYAYANWKRFDGSKFVIQVAISSDFGQTWQDPTSTPTGTTPNLSEPGCTSDEPDLTTDASGRYVYAIWDREEAFITIIQVAISSDFGVTWTNPTTTPSGTTTPNLSDSGQPADHPHIVTDNSGRYVYAIWYRNDGINDIIQVAISSDFGVTWANPTTTPSGTTTPNLSDSGQTAIDPQIVTDSSGKYVYAVWQRSNGIEDIIQIAISSDFGQTWQDPTSTPPGTTTPNLSGSGGTAVETQVITDSSGRYVYVVWDRVNGSGNPIIQIAISSDFGVTWQNPSSTPPGTTTPNLSDPGPPGGTALVPFASTDSTGRYVYVIWNRSDGSDTRIQVAISHDFGQTWQDPVSTTPGNTTPNLSDSGESAAHERIKVDSSGRYLYAIWHRVIGGNTIIQAAVSCDFGQTWQDPTSTPLGTTTPNLSILGAAADHPHIIMNSTGSITYAVWFRADGSNTCIQIANGLKTFAPVKKLTFMRGG